MVAEASLSKGLYKAELYLIKTIPMLFARVSLLNDVLSYFCIDLPILSYIASVSILTLAFMYLSSIVFKFCIYHRMFIHYTTVNWLLNIIDYYIGIPLNESIQKFHKKGSLLAILLLTLFICNS